MFQSSILLFCNWTRRSLDKTSCLLGITKDTFSPGLSKYVPVRIVQESMLGRAYRNSSGPQQARQLGGGGANIHILVFLSESYPI